MNFLPKFNLALKTSLNIDDRSEINVIITQEASPRNTLELPIEATDTKEALYKAKIILEDLIEQISENLGQKK